MKKYIDFKFYPQNFIAVAVLVLSLIYFKIFNVEEILENTIYENIAVIPLLAGFFLCLRAKKHKVIFRMIAIFLLLLVGREFNYGRVPFCAIPDNPHEFYPWSHYKYGYLAHVFIGIYIAIGIIYGLVNKFWVDIVEIIKKVAFPFWTYFMAVGFIIIQMYCEKVLDYTPLEEMSEFIIYCLILALVMIYTKKVQD